jgi:hypothetical protein
MPNDKMMDPKELWVGWTRDAARMYVAPDEIEDDELVDDMIEVTSDYASGMLDAFEQVFGSIEGRTRDRGERESRTTKRGKSRGRRNESERGNEGD